jgi:Na+-driven multidrug efflux pump
MVSFLNMRGWGLFFAAQHMTLVGFFIGLGKTRIILVSAIVIAVCNIFLDYCFIHGNLGFNAMGMVGAPLASSIAEAIGFLFLLLFLISKADFKKFGYSLKRKINLPKYFALVKLSFPMMLQGVAALSTWLVFFTLVEHMGTEALETAQNIRYMYFLAFIPIFGFAAATKTIMSNLAGQGRMDLIFKTQNRIILLSVISMLVVFHGALLYPETLVRLINHNPNMSDTVLNDSIFILKFISGSIFIFSVAVVYFNVIAGLGKTTIYFFIELVSILLYLIGCYFFIVRWNWDIKYIWAVEYIYFLGFGIFSTLYLHYYRKNKLKYA